MMTVTTVGLYLVRGDLWVARFHKLIKWSGPEEKHLRYENHTVHLSDCGCSRTLPLRGQSSDLMRISPDSTTCLTSAWARGPGQRVIAYSFYGDVNSEAHKGRRYFQVIKENLAIFSTFYGDLWKIRVHHDIAPGSHLHEKLCRLSCSNHQIDMSHVKHLPHSLLPNASLLFPMNWRFLPTLDLQVSLFLSRDLESRLSQRGVFAVSEWVDSGRADLEKRKGAQILFDRHI